MTPEEKSVTLKDFPDIDKYDDESEWCHDVGKWKVAFEGKTVPHLLERIRRYKDKIPIDMVIKIIEEELYGNQHENSERKLHT